MSPNEDPPAVAVVVPAPASVVVRGLQVAEGAQAVPVGAELPAAAVDAAVVGGRPVAVALHALMDRVGLAVHRS